jgi:pyruvate formate lyase activating enzyme
MRHTIPTRYWHALDDGRVQCDICPRACRLRERQHGPCFVRANEGGQIVLTTYGRSSGYCVDPIEKKPLDHFLPGTPVLSFGTAGCNLACKFCQNWDISKSRVMDTLADEASPERIAQAAEALGCRSVSGWHLEDDGQCWRCGTRCAGVFEARPGHWGARRLPVKLAGVSE